MKAVILIGALMVSGCATLLESPGDYLMRISIEFCEEHPGAVRSAGGLQECAIATAQAVLRQREETECDADLMCRLDRIERKINEAK